MNRTGQISLPTNGNGRDIPSRLPENGPGAGDGSGIAPSEIGPKRDRKSQRSLAERAARAEFKSRLGHPLNDSDWKKQRHRLVEFILTLARWDSEQRKGNVGSVPERKRAS